MTKTEVEIDGGVATIVIGASPDGYMNAEILADVARVFYRLERDETVRAERSTLPFCGAASAWALTAKFASDTRLSPPV